jgi:hypothetical protein
VIYLGIDDTDMPGTPGTNQLARRLIAALPAGFGLRVALRHQLLLDSRVPYTSKNGSASLLLDAAPGRRAADLLPVLRREMRQWYQPGSDPGLCAADRVPVAIGEFGRRCQREVVRQDEARALARAHGVHLEGLGGTEDGVIGALAAVGLLAGGDDGRVVHLPGWSWPDGFAGPRPLAAVLGRGVDEIRQATGDEPVTDGVVDVGKHLRPSFRGGRVVLFVEPCGNGATPTAWRAVKLP